MKKLKQVEKAITIIGAIVLLGALIWMIVEECCNSGINANIARFIIVVDGILAPILLRIVYQLEINLRNKHFRTVSDEDKLVSEKLIDRIQRANMGNNNFLDECNYFFLEQEEYYVSLDSIESILEELAKGYKIDEQLVKVYFDIREQIESSPYKDDPSNAEFNEFIRDLCELFERNKCVF